MRAKSNLRKTVSVFSTMADRFADGDAVRGALRDSRDPGLSPDFAARNRILPQVYRNINRLGLENETPHELLKSAMDASRAAAAYNMLLQETGKDILAAAASSGVAVIPFKGLSLFSRGLYDTGERSMSDLDFIVRKSSLGELDEMMRSQGWSREPAPLPSEFEEEFSGERKYTKERGGARIDTEFRWEPSPGPALGRAFPLDPETAWRLSLPSGYPGGGPALSVEAELILCIHHLAALHSFGRLMWFLDVRYLMEEYRESIDWKLLWGELKKAGLLRAAGAISDFLEKYFEMECFPGSEKAGGTKSERAFTEKLIIQSLCGGRIKTAGVIPGLVADRRREYFAGYFFPGRRYLRMRYPGVPAPLLPFHRAVRLVKKGVSGARSS